MQFLIKKVNHNCFYFSQTLLVNVLRTGIYLWGLSMFQKKNFRIQKWLRSPGVIYRCHHCRCWPVVGSSQEQTHLHHDPASTVTKEANILRWESLQSLIIGIPETDSISCFVLLFFTINFLPAIKNKDNINKNLHC